MTGDGTTTQLLVACNRCDVQEWVYKDEHRTACWLCGRDGEVLNSRTAIDQRGS